MVDKNNQEQVFNIRDYLQLVVKRKWYLIMPTIIAPLTAILATFFIVPTYKSSTSILLKETNVLPSTVQRELSTEGSNYRRQSTSEIQNMMASQIKSTKYIRSLIAKLDIPMPNEVKNAVSENTQGLSEADASELAENLLIASLREKIDVTASGSNIINISISSDSPVMAKKMTQTLAEIFLEESLAQELAGIQGNISFTEEQLAVYREKLFSAQNQLKQFRQGVISTSVDADTTTLNYSLNSIFSAVEALDIEINNAETRQTQLRINLLPQQIDLSAIILPKKVTDIKQDLLNTVPRLAELLGRYSWRDAKVVALNEEAKGISNSLEREITDFAKQNYPNLPDFARDDLAEYLILSADIEYMRNKSAAMSKSIGKIKSLLTKDPDIEVSLDRLQSEVDRYRELYELFVQHSQYAAIDQSAKKIEAESKYMIVQPAELPLSPESPNRVKMTILGIVLGVMLGVGVILLLMILDDSYKKVEEIEHDLKLPVLATIPLLITPYQTNKKERGLIYGGMVVSLILIAAIIFMKIKNG